MLLDNNSVDSFLCVYRNLKLALTFEDFYITLVPHKNHFLVTVEYHGNEIYQNWFNTWEESYKKYQELCSKYLDECTEKLKGKNSNNTFDNGLPF